MVHRFVVVALAASSLAACSDRTTPTSPRLAPSRALSDKVPSSTAQLVRLMAAGRGIVPLPKAPRVRPKLVRLGQALAFDKILSGNRDISCMTCHLPAFATGDGKSLSVGQGGIGLGPTREHPNGVFIPRNAPPLFNLNAMMHLFWDGRVSVDAAGTFHTPAGDQLTPGMTRVFEFGAISALGLFPVTNRSEMRAALGDNEIANISDDDLTGIWAALMRRLGAIPKYRRMFEEAYEGTKFDDMNFAYASNAIAGFIVDRFTFANTPWDRFLDGNDHALSDEQLAGAQTFLTLKCSICHTGATFSDEQFHDVAVAQIGPGEGDGPTGRDDFGRLRVTGDASDLYRFRTTPLRNVELSGPYGHNGAITTLRAFVEHYSESDTKLFAYDVTQLEPRLQGTLLNTQTAILAQRDTLLNGVVLTDALVDQLMAYMSALTDNAARDLSKSVPKRVPSGLPIDRP
ncbi:MAG TPA: cytochrome c peroxidase [Gemmatimonadaceae bacterium]|nr:cytochrome c peroxidase [Gemmatimonadaceae bacterium]